MCGYLLTLVLLIVNYFEEITLTHFIQLFCIEKLALNAILKDIKEMVC